MLIQKTKVGPWEVNTHSHPIQMSEVETDMLSQHLRRWRICFPRSNNLAELAFDVPSVLVRFDYVMKDGVPHKYEIEERPAGIGATAAIHSDFLPRLMPVIREQEDLLGMPWSIYISDLRDGSSDDDVFAERAGIRVFRGRVPVEVVRTRAWYVRANRNEHGVADLFTWRSLSSIEHEGNKSYGKPMGMWESIHADYEPDFGTAFAVKPSSGSRFEEVLLWNPDKKRGAGFATKTKILDAIRAGKVRYLQPYHAPEEATFLGPEFNLIRRAYFAWSPKKRDYVSVGGCWMATPTARVHGTRDAVSGVLLTA